MVKRNKVIFALFTLMAVAFYILGGYTPLYTDDFDYYFRIPAPPGIAETNIFFRGYLYAFGFVARMVPHLFVALFQWSGKWLYNILSSIALIVLCWQLGSLSTNDREKIPAMSLMGLILVWFFIPGFYQGVLWMSGGCNYLIPAVIVLTYLGVFMSHKHVGRLGGLIYVIIGFITGWTNEGFVIGLCAGCVCFLLFTSARQISKHQTYLTIGLFIGATLICFSPFNLYRFQEGHQDDGISIIVLLQSALAMTNVRLTLILLLCIIVRSLIGRHLPSLKQLKGEKMIVPIAFIVSFIFIIITRHSSDYSRFPFEIYALVLILRIISKIKAIFLADTAILFGVIMVLSCTFLLPVAQRNFDCFNNMTSQMTAGNKIVSIDNLPLTSWEKRFIVPCSRCVYQNNITLNKDSILKYYGGNPNAVCMPSEILSRTAKAKDYVGLHPKNSWNATWIKLPQSMDSVRNVTFLLTPVNPHDLPLWQRPFFPYLNRLKLNSLDASNYKIIDVDSPRSRWLFVEDNEMISDRVRAIKIEIVK